MAQHFFKIGMEYTSKNKLHEDFHAFVKTWDNTLLISDVAKKEFVGALHNKLNKLNKKHHRCKPIEIHFFKWSTTGIRVDGNFTADIFQVKHELMLNTAT